MNPIMDTFLKTLLIFASMSALPYYLIFYQDIWPFYAIPGSAVVCMFLSAVFLTPRRPAQSAAPQAPSQPPPTTSASAKPRSRLGYS